MSKDMEFLAYLRARRKELKAELRSIDEAEQVYLASQSQSDQKAVLFAQYPVETRAPQSVGTIKSMVMSLLVDTDPEGLTANDLLSDLRERWLPKLERTSLSPQLSRLKREGKIENFNGKWRLRNQT